MINESDIDLQFYFVDRSVTDGRVGGAGASSPSAVRPRSADSVGQFGRAGASHSQLKGVPEEGTLLISL